MSSTKGIHGIIFSLVLGANSLAVAGPAAVSSLQTDDATRAKALDVYSHLPLAFEMNEGQSDPQVKALARGAAYGLFLTSDEAVLDLAHQNGKGAVLRMKVEGAQSGARVVPMDPLPGKVNSFIGNDSSKWKSGVSVYKKVKYQGIYAGVDLVYYGNQQELEYDFIVSPGADPAAIRLGVDGAKVRIDSHGDLVLHTAVGDVRHHKPVIYQEIDGVRHEIAGHFVKKSNREIAFAVAPYDPHHDLVIDPSLAWSTYLGGANQDRAITVAVDQFGDTHIGGWTASHKFPTNGTYGSSPYPNYCVPTTTCNPTTDAFFSVIYTSGNGGNLFISTYYGGSTGSTSIEGIVTYGNNVPTVYVVGTTSAKDIPLGSGSPPLQSANAGGNDAFMAKLGLSGIEFCTYLGGSGDETATGITLDSQGDVIVSGYTTSTNFPTANAFQSTNNGSVNTFVTKYNSLLNAYVYSTYLGGPGIAVGNKIADGNSDVLYIAGQTTSVTPFSKTAKSGNVYKGFLAALNFAGSAEAFPTIIFGGSGNTIANGVVVDSTGNVWVAGYTSSTDFQTLNPIQASNAGSYDIFLQEYTSGGTLQFSTYLGGSGTDQAMGLAIVPPGQVPPNGLLDHLFIAGTTNSTDLIPPALVSTAVQATNKGGYDGFVIHIVPGTGGAPPTIGYATYLGGSDSDVITGVAAGKAGNATVAGYTNSTNYPTTPGVIQPHINGTSCPGTNNPTLPCSDVMVTKINTVP